MTFYDRYEQHLRERFGDEQVVEDWCEAIRLDQEDPDSGAIIAFVDGIQTGTYWEQRKNKERAAKIPERVYPVGREIAAARVRAGMRQRELAGATGMSPDYLAKIERGVRRLSFDAACRLADALGVSLDALRP